jgi:hypothetical protein
MVLPDPHELRQRKKYGREEYVQELLAALIVGDTPPRWNMPALPTVPDLGSETSSLDVERNVLLARHRTLMRTTVRLAPETGTATAETVR